MPDLATLPARRFVRDVVRLPCRGGAVAAALRQELATTHTPSPAAGPVPVAAQQVAEPITEDLETLAARPEFGPVAGGYSGVFDLG